MIGHVTFLFVSQVSLGKYSLIGENAEPNRGGPRGRIGASTGAQLPMCFATGQLLLEMEANADQGHSNQTT